MVEHVHLLLERQDGQVVPVLTHAARLPETSGQQTRAVLVHQDVTDAGIGIPADQLERIFSRFHRVDPASPVRGTGLGLYLSRALIEAQTGHLAARD